MKSVLWSIRRPHTDNIKNGNKWDEIRKIIPKQLTRETVNYIYETKANGGCGKVIGEFKVQNKTYIYADIVNGVKHLYNTAFIMPALSDEELFTYLYDGKQNDGWALRISDLKIYDKPKALSEFSLLCKRRSGVYSCDYCKYLTAASWDGLVIGCDRRLRHPPQSWCYMEEI